VSLKASAGRNYSPVSQACLGSAHFGLRMLLLGKPVRMRDFEVIRNYVLRTFLTSYFLQICVVKNCEIKPSCGQ
jgi:hypothetical protein